MTTEEIREVTLEDEQFSAWAELKFHSWPCTKTRVQKELYPYWSFRDELAIIDRIGIKGWQKNNHANITRQSKKETTYQ